MDKTKYEIYKHIAKSDAENSTGLVELGIGSLILILSMFVAPVVGTVAGGILGFLYIKKSLEDGENNTRAIEDKGVVSPFLKRDYLMDYVKLVGRDQVESEWNSAKDLGLKVRELDDRIFRFEKGHGKTIDVESKRVIGGYESPEKKLGSGFGEFVDRLNVEIEDELETATQETIGAYQRLIEDGKSIAIYASSGRGKTVFARELIDGMRAKSPNMVIVAIDPKGIEGESGFWNSGVFDSVSRIDKNFDPEIRANMIYSALKRYKKLSIEATKSNRAFCFLLDECIITTLTINGSTIKDEVNDFIKDWIGGIVSAGHATRQSIILMTQTSQNDSLPIPTYLRNQLTGIIIAAKPQADLNACNSCNPKIVPNDKAVISSIQDVIDLSGRMMAKSNRPPLGRAIFITTENRWFPVYPIEIQGTDRDLGKFVMGDTTSPMDLAQNPIQGDLEVEPDQETIEVDDNEPCTVNRTQDFHILIETESTPLDPSPPEPIPTEPSSPEPTPLPSASPDLMERLEAIREATQTWKPVSWIYDKVPRKLKRDEGTGELLSRPEFTTQFICPLVDEGKLLATGKSTKQKTTTYYKWKNVEGTKG